MPKTTNETPNKSKILVAEDNIELGLFWEDWLKQAGYAVTRATTKAAALAKFQPNAFALAVLDMRMPSTAQSRGINIKAGLEAAVEIRRLDPTLPVLFLTASSDEEIEAKALKLKTSFTRKPCGMEAFLIRVREMDRHQFPFGPQAVINADTCTVTVTITITKGKKKEEKEEQEERHIPPQVRDLAVVLNRNKGIPLSRVELVRQWGWNESSLDECIRKLREAVDDNEHTIIKTIHGTGYMYDPAAE